MVAAVMVLGVVAEVVLWRLVAARRVDIWVVMSPIFGALGVVVLVMGRADLSPVVSPRAGAAAGVSAGIALYLATRAVVRLARPWEAFQRHGAEMYAHGRRLPLAVALLLSAGIIAAGEELFWRGLFLGRLSEAVGRVGGAALSWAVYVGANLPSANLAVAAAALVGGGVWTGLALWTRGVLASVLCHAVWTALMVSFPVVRRATAGAGP